MAKKTSLSELRNKIAAKQDVTRGPKGGVNKGRNTSQVTRDIRKNFRKTV
jgi:hypothetical protein